MIELFSHPLFSDANLTHYWRAEGNSNDSKGSLNGTDANITYSAGNGKFGQGWGLNGSNSKVTFGNPSVGANFTIMGNVKPTGNLGNTTQGLLDTDPGGVGALQLRGHGSSNLRYGIGGVGTAQTSVIGDWTGTYHHLALIVSGGTNLRVVADGVDIGNNTFGGSASSTALILGNINGIDWYNGAMDDWATFSRALSVAEILAFVNYERANPGSPLFFNTGVAIG